MKNNTQTKLPDITTNFSDWYNEIVYTAQLADQAPVRGCMVMRPYGYALWENITKILDEKIKETGHQNVAFPLLIPLSFLQKEAKHVEGFAPEIAVVTHAGGKELEEPLVVRPTSETIIHYMFARWLKSWRDLPIKINQWASVVRWEMRTRPFLRTTEFWWQEGHTAHETEQEAQEEALLMLKEYRDLVESYLAIPVITGEKSPAERFAGADITYTIEGLMPDGKALQMGTSHIISQNFAKSFDMKYQDRQGNTAYPYLTSWAVTTRLIGALIMTHGDQKGLVLPPAIAPIQIVIIPIFKQETKADVLRAAEELKKTLDPHFRVVIDADEHETPGAKFYNWELRGIPVRLELGPRDISQKQVVLVTRHTGTKQTVPWDMLAESAKKILDTMQLELLSRAKQKRDEQWHTVDSIIAHKESLEHQGGIYQTGWCGSARCEAQLKEYKATIRCLIQDKTHTLCGICSEPAQHEILIARAY